MKRCFATFLLALPVIVALAPARADVARAIEVALTRLAFPAERIAPTPANENEGAFKRFHEPGR
jgi:hypothetical protein